MIERSALLTDLKKQVTAAERDLAGQIKAVGETGDRLRAEYDQARKLGRTAATWNAWRDERVTQVAVAWVLGSVFVRFSEDNGLIPEPYITAPTVDGRELAQARYEAYMAESDDPTYRGWLEAAFADLGSGQAGRLLFDRRHNPLYQIPLSHDGAGALLDFWRTTDATGVLVHDFTDAEWDTRFLGDLYQDLSDAARESYALLQTPEFVEEFILDRTMDPAVREFGFAGLKMIDPTCGSGHFVLGAFRRLVGLWEEQRPGADLWDRVRAALDSVHGVDMNPFAVAIARFRLLVAAMRAAGMATLAEAVKVEWPIHLAVGDSLIKARQLELTLDGEGHEDPLTSFAYRTEDLPEYPGILEENRYHVVVGNPPYITVKDKELNQRYREMYSACHKEYQLSVPFAQRFFELAKRGDAEDGLGYGMVGQITSNGFIKREFGAKLIEEYFGQKAELTEIIDTSGAYVPGHGTPTVILIGRPRGGKHRTPTVRTVRSVQGEPGVPENPATGLVWTAIVEQIEEPGSSGRWVSVDDLDRMEYFAKRPWVLADGGQELLKALDDNSNQKLRSAAKRFGYTGQTNADGIMISSHDAWLRRGGEESLSRTLVLGEELRDWTHTEGSYTFFPYKETREKFELLSLSDNPGAYSWMWPGRTSLGHRATFSKGTYFSDGRPWYEWHQVTPSPGCHNWSISFAFVATHNHFVLDRGGKVFNRSAPVIKLREEGSEEEHLRLLGLLNSSTAGFWLKMVSHDKGSQGVNEGYKSQVWERFYEFTGTKLQEFPLPTDYPTALGTTLDALAQQLSTTTPGAVATAATPTAPALREARTAHDYTRARMIALQEELDWQVYSLYKLLDEDLHLPDPDDVPELNLGERAFEIVLARRVANGEASDEWFKRHGSTPITESPAHWPTAYRELVQKRINVIESSRAIGMVERPEYKRRWATDGWDKMQAEALRSWLLDRIEDRSHWFDANGQPSLVTLSRLADDLSRDEEFVTVAALYKPREELYKVVAGLMAEEHVPFVAALRYKPAALGKRQDWEFVWDKQREEDAAPDEETKRKVRKETPVPPKYTSADFLRGSFWKHRGKLDVPKERFISYGVENVQSPQLYGWAGWSHKEQAAALAAHIYSGAVPDEEITAYLAGLLELQPWLKQWHDEFDVNYGGSPADTFKGLLLQLQGERGLTEDDLRAWRPTAAKRGGGGRKPKAKAAEAEADATPPTDDD